MALAQLIVATLSQTHTLLSIAVVLVAIYLINFVRQVRTLPPGPPPLPIIGNILQLRAPRPMYEKAIAWSKQYGDPFTVWIGTRPMVIANNKESFKDISGPLRNQVGGRMRSKLGDLQSRGFGDVLFSDFNPTWDVLRRLVHVAIRKYAQTERLAELVAHHVDLEVDGLLGDPKQMRRGSIVTQVEGKQVKKVRTEVVAFVEDIINNVVAVSAFGEGFRKGDPDYERMRYATKAFEEELPNGFPSDILWILGLIFYKKERLAQKVMEDFFSVTDKMFEQAAESFTPGKSRHFTDTLLNAREQFLAEDRASSKYLTDENLRQAVFDIFGAGIGTSKTVISFAMLNMANNPKLQEELREEVIDVLGTTKICISSDRARMPMVDSFIQEVIRFFPPAPLSLPRKAMADSIINGRSIPKDSSLFINVYAVNRDPDIWGSDANTFNPKRFISATKDQIARGANSFGIGSRSCPGEKMAQADIFYTIVRILQLVRLSCPNGAGTAKLESIDSDILLDVRRQDIDFARI